MLKIMIKAAAREVLKWLNMFLPKGGISSIYSPRAIVLGKLIDYKKYCIISFGSYVQVLQENNPTNIEAPRTIDAIYLQALDND